MIIVRLMGGLGNQMFQYAAARRLSQVSCVPLKLDLGWFGTIPGRDTPRPYSLHPFNIVEEFASPDEVAHFAPRFGTLARLAARITSFRGTWLRERHFRFDPDLLVPRRKAYLDGYWQSEKYFSGIREIICSDFTLKDEPEGMNSLLAMRLRDPALSSVALHVRRGDYVSDPHTAKMHGSCSQRYYADAVRLVAAKTARPHFFIFSDDPGWVIEHFPMEHPHTVVGHNGPDHAHEDLRLMSMCRHHIIANSTFSWWGAWLCRDPGKLVVAPHNWFAGASHDAGDVVPASWTRI